MPSSHHDDSPLHWLGVIVGGSVNKRDTGDDGDDSDDGDDPGQGEKELLVVTAIVAPCNIVLYSLTRLS